MWNKLFQSLQLIPKGSFQDRFISIIRLILFCGVILWLFDVQYSLLFVCVSILLITLFYKRKGNEMYDKTETINTQEETITDFPSGETIPFCDDQVSVEDVQSTNKLSLNQRLAVKNVLDAHPATKVRPVIPPPAYDLDSWKQNDTATISIINKAPVHEEVFQSGYVESSKYPEKYTHDQIVAPRPVVTTTPIPTLPVSVTENWQDIRSDPKLVAPRPVVTTTPIPTLPVNSADVVEGYNGPQEYESVQTYPGMINESCGYDKTNVNYNLPSNIPFGNCYRTTNSVDYNKNIFTQTITPGNYSINEIAEPINANIGISFTQQFEPTTKRSNAYGTMYTGHDYKIVGDNGPEEEKEDYPNYDNVYDPRFYGYGTSYRSYLEPMTGQTRFIYDDVNSVRMQNYITRSKIDHLNVDREVVERDPRVIANNSWLDNSVNFRDDLQQRLTRKINAQHWQKRLFPNSMRPVGSGKVIR
jgi:hypothetical protein